MLEDFLDNNKLKSKIITYPTEINLNMVASKNFFPKTSIIKTNLFITKENELYLTIIPFFSEINFEKLRLLIKEKEFLEIEKQECLEITGYKKEYLPPLSIYGINILVESSLKNKKSIFSKISEKQILQTEMEELIEFNESVDFANLI